MRFQASEMSFARSNASAPTGPIQWSVDDKNRLAGASSTGIYTYRIDINGNITLVQSPAGGAGKVVTPASGAAYNAIIEQYDKLIRPSAAYVADEVLRRAEKARAVYKSKGSPVATAREAAPSDLPPSAGGAPGGGKGGGPIGWVKEHPLAAAGIGAGIVVLAVGVGIWYTDSQAAAEARAAGRVRL